jgi:hypothetical protein
VCSFVTCNSFWLSWSFCTCRSKTSLGRRPLESSNDDQNWCSRVMK